MVVPILEYGISQCHENNIIRLQNFIYFFPPNWLRLRRAQVDPHLVPPPLFLDQSVPHPSSIAPPIALAARLGVKKENNNSIVIIEEEKK